ncbi:MAG: hypothetical protein A2Z18_08915 [Armatimonadetes bacterium RBG_16_58_9]|nr:MAG: hypothetical protein A2Z18_08915 [Armatimonadetes bacterium RBG_16_58_9]
MLECGYKLVSSAAHAASEAQVPAELVAPRGWATSLEELKHLVDWQASLGVNLFCPSAFEYTIAPRSAPSQFIQATYWPHYRILSDYAARLGCVLSQGSHSAQAAILCPVDEPGPQATSGRVHFSVELLCECLYLYCSALLRMHVDFDILGEDLIGGGFVSDQRLLLAGEGYELLILPPMQAVRYDTAVRIREFWEDGGKVVASPPLPCREAEGTRHREVKKMFEDMFGECRSNTDEPVPRDNVLLPAADAPADLIAGLTDGVSRLIKSEVSVRMGGEECGDITFLHRTTSREEVFFFSNNADGPREAQISIRCVGAPHMLNPETGNVTALPNCTQKGNRTILLHRFERHGSLLVMFNDEPALAVAQPLIEEGQEIPLSDEWEFVPRHGNSLTIHDWRLEMPIHGVSEQVCTASFEASFRPNDLMLVLEDCREEHAMLCVRVNGKPACEVAGRTPDGGFRCFNIAPLAVIGVNTVEIVSDMHCFPTETAKPRIVGAFSLDETGNVLCPPRDRIRTGSWTEQGYPFYSGAAVYAQTVTIPQFLRSQKVVIETERPADMVEFAVNSQSAGVRAWAPFQVDITRLVQPGENRIEITVTNSAANALLSDARPSGLLGATRIIVS